MTLLTTILLVLFLLVSIFLVILILVQQGKGAGMGASFGAGASNTLFGSVGSAGFLTKFTWSLTFLFFALSIALGYLNAHRVKNDASGSFEQIEEVAAPATVKAVDVNQEPNKDVKDAGTKDSAKKAGGPAVEIKKSQEVAQPKEVKAPEAQPPKVQEVPQTQEAPKTQEAK